MATVNKEAFDRVTKELENGSELDLSQLGSIFGQSFWELIVMLLLDSQDAARAIQMATLRIRAGVQDSLTDEDIDDEDIDD